MRRSSPDSEQSSQSGGRDSPTAQNAAGNGANSVSKENPDAPPAKRQKLVTFEPVRLSSVSSVVDLDVQTVCFQNRKLSERLQHRNRTEAELRRRIEQLQKRQTQDDTMLCVINRHWNQLDEEVRTLLQRFDAETSVEDEVKNEDSATSSFLSLLSQWDDEEIDKNLSQRVEFSVRAISKLVQVYDRILQRNSQVCDKINALATGNYSKDSGNDDKSAAKSADVGPSSPSGSQDKEASNSSAATVSEESRKVELEESLRQMNKQLVDENRRLQTVVTKMQHKNHKLSAKHAGCEDSLNQAETREEEMQNKLEDALFEHEKTMQREDKLDFRLAEVVRELQTAQLELATLKGGKEGADSASTKHTEITNVSKNKLQELQANLEEQRELATNRLSELQELKDQKVHALKEAEQLKMKLDFIPPEVIHESSEYKCLQSAFTVLHTEALRIQEHLADSRAQLNDMKIAHLKQIEQLEAEELLAQKQLRQEMVQLEDQLSQVRKEYEMLRVEFEQNLAANEQSGPLNREMRQLLNSYKSLNQQLKAEVARFKKKWKEGVSTIAKIQKELDAEKKLKEKAIVLRLEPPDGVEIAEMGEQSFVSTATDSDQEEEEGELPENEKSDATDVEKLTRKIEFYKERCKLLRAQLASVKDLPEEQRDKLELMGREKRLRSENQKLREKTRLLLVEGNGNEASRILREEDLKRIRYLEEQNDKLKKEAANVKQEEAMLLTEMETTGQAFEESQERCAGIVQQLQEKEDANFKLMSDRIRSNQQHKKLKEEKELLEERVAALDNQVAAQNLVVRKLEEKERLLQQHLSTVQKESSMRVQALELNKRKAMEYAQTSADYKLQVEKQTSQLSEFQVAVATKTASLEDESFKIRRLKEEISGLRKRVERAQKFEDAERFDEVLLEEIRELKEQLTCPSCKVQKKDAFLTKCFHVFCFECLKTRYETRRRKCPKCNAAFGGNDYKRIYIS